MCGMDTSMFRKFKKYWKSYSIILSIAMVLDPRYKLNLVKFYFSKLNSDTAEEKPKVVKDKIKILFKEYLVPSITLLSEKRICGGDINNTRDPFEEFDVFQSQLESSSGKTQIDLYLEEANLDRRINLNLNVLGYWKDNRQRYLELSLMVRDILSVPITTVASKSAFKVGGRVIGKFRSSILPTNVEAILCNRDWIFGEDLDGSGSEFDSDEDEIVVDLQPYLEKLKEIASKSYLGKPYRMRGKKAKEQREAPKELDQSIHLVPSAPNKELSLTVTLPPKVQVPQKQSEENRMEELYPLKLKHKSFHAYFYGMCNVLLSPTSRICMVW
ncbi:hypothetical protein P3S68_021287 [Capsicum galapagoense]